MTFKRGYPKPKSSGRQPGQRNHMTMVAREAIDYAYLGQVQPRTPRRVRSAYSARFVSIPFLRHPPQTVTRTPRPLTPLCGIAHCHHLPIAEAVTATCHAGAVSEFSAPLQFEFDGVLLCL
jgi:hypothetical protein